MRNLNTLGAACAFALVAAAVHPASAATLGVQFTGTPNSTNNNSNGGTGFAYNLLDIDTSITVTGLGEFVDGSLSKISTSGGQMPIPGGGSTPAGDWVYVGTGSVPSSSNSFGSSALFSAEITAADASLVGTYWAFTSITPEVLAAGDYWIAVVYGNINTSVFSTSSVTPQAGISLLGGATCGSNNACSGTTGETFGPNFEDNVAATPLPATLSLFAGGLGMVGFLARRRKRNAANA